MRIYFKYIKRNNHHFMCDIDFDTKINFSMFCKDNI